MSERDTLSGEHISLAEPRSGATLVHFFATWCELCRVELNALQQLHARVHDKSITIIGVDVGEVVPRLQRFFDAQPASFPVLLDGDRAVSKAWQVSILPTTFLLDGDLVRRFVVESDVDWNGQRLAFLMYPQAECGNARLDSLDPDTFKYTITAKELAGA